MATISIDDDSLEYEFWGPPESELPTVLLLHETAGSVKGWGDFGLRLAEAVGCRVFAYSRLGYGGSDPLQQRMARGYLEREALDVLPRVRELLRLDRVVLAGFQDGATIGLIHAGGAEQSTLGVVAIAPLLFVDPVTQRAVQAMASQLENPSIKEIFAATPSHHDRTFAQWAQLWQSPDFQGWHVDDSLRLITVPVLAVRGEGAPSSSADHLERLKGLCTQVEEVVIAGCQKTPHLERPQALVNELTAFVRRVAASG